MGAGQPKFLQTGTQEAEGPSQNIQKFFASFFQKRRRFPKSLSRNALGRVSWRGLASIGAEWPPGP